jgi:CheY-like chemotaxis protein
MSQTVEPWVLCVDDEPKVLEGLELNLGFDYEVRTAVGGEVGLEVLQSQPGCAVIISDMRMPGMNGSQFLARARELTPDTTRMLLTGFSDIADTIAAINDGGIFRFLSKPTAPDALKRAVDDGLRQWQLIQSERVLLEQTLHGAAEALVEALEIASPASFSRARRIESASRHVAIELGLEPVWEVALAGLLVRLGWIAIPTETVDCFLAGQALTEAETSMFEAAYATSVRLVGRIPRLDGVAQIIAGAADPSGAVDPSTAVRAVSEFDQLCGLGRGGSKGLKELDGRYPREILIALNSWTGAGEEVTVQEVGLRGLVTGMVAENDIVTEAGTLLVRSGTDITETVIQRLRNSANSQGIEEPITVSVRSG